MAIALSAGEMLLADVEMLFFRWMDLSLPRLNTVLWSLGLSGMLSGSWRWPHLQGINQRENYEIRLQRNGW